MAARPPPARPHIALNPNSSFSTHKSKDWAEDDAWDSGSDSEEPRTSTISHGWAAHPKRQLATTSSAVSAPQPVPRLPNNPSSSNIAFSYTHLNAPSPRSYSPTQSDTTSTPPNKGGEWTIVRKPSIPNTNTQSRTPATRDSSLDAGFDCEMVVGDFDPDEPEQTYTSKPTPPSTTKPDADKIVNDPFVSIHKSAEPDENNLPKATRSTSPSDSAKLMRERSIRTNRRLRFIECLRKDDINIAELRKLAWAGTPSTLRPVVWPLLLGYLPLAAPARSATLTRKREEYRSLVQLAFKKDRQGLDQQIWHQIEIDVPRTRPGTRLWMQECTQSSLARILYVWAIRHPASGYVQGINDLVTPFFQVFLSAYIDSDPEQFDTASLPESVKDAIEADSFWCLSRLLDGIQDNYIATQPGIQRSVKRMAELVARIDAPLYAHLESESVEFMQFAFRWMNCLLMREISVQNTIRMWDTYLAEGTDAFSQFHLYVCSAFLVKWSEKLRKMDFQGIIMFLQSPPTQDWDDHEIEMLLSEAFVLNSIWHNAQSHFGAK